MRKKILQSAVLVLAMAFMIGCSSDDSSSNGGGGNPGGDNSGGDNTGGENGEDGDDTSKVYQYAQKILVEDVTSASCVWCPLASFTTEELAKSEYDNKVVSVAIHDDFNIRNVKDPFVIEGVSKIHSVLRTGRAYPFVAWNRNTTIKGTEFQNFLAEDRIDNRLQIILDFDEFKQFHTKYNLFTATSPIGIKIESNLQQTEGEVSISVRFGADINEEMKYLVYILEDGLKFQQANASSLYGNNTNQARWEMNFIHNQVVRATNKFEGELIPASESVTTNIFKTTTKLTYKVENLENASVVVAVLDKAGKVLNVQKAKANTKQNYQIVK